MDEVDQKILFFLLKNGRMPLTELSENLNKFGINISDPSIKRRILKLMDSGIIRKFSVDLNYDQIGLPFLALVFLKVDSYRVSEVARRLSRLSEVRDIYIVRNDYSVLVTIQCADYKEINKLIERLASSRNIIDTKTCVILDSFSKFNSTSLVFNKVDILVDDIDRDKENEVILDNSLLSIAIKPRLCAKIFECILKETANNMVKHEEGMLLDNFAEEGWGKLANLPTTWEVLEINDKLVKVKFSMIFNGAVLKNILLEKIITMYSESNILSVEYRITNRSNEQQEVTLWVSNYMSIGGDVNEADCFFLPIEGKMESDLYKHQIIHVLWPVKPEYLGKKAYYYITMEHPEVRDQKVSDGWAAWMNTRSEETVCFFWKNEEVAYIKKCFMLNSYSIEIIYNTAKLNPKEHVDHNLFFFVGKGSQDLILQYYKKMRSVLK